MLDGVLLDWEGVLADTGAARRDALLRALSDESVPFDAMLHDEHCAGLAVGAAAAVAVALHGAPDPTLAELVALRARRYFAARMAQGFALRPGALRFLDPALARAPLVISTAATGAETEAALRLAGLQDSFSAVVTADDVLEPAPSAELFDLAVTRLQRRRAVRRERVIAMLGTGPALRAAREAGLRTIAVGAAAHVALEADGAVESLDGITVDDLVSIAAQPGARRP